MYLITNAIKNLTRYKGRNILLAAVTLAIIIGAVVTLTIHSAAERAIDNVRLDIGSQVTIEQDILGMFRSGGAEALEANTEYIPFKDLISFADSQYLSNTIFNAEVMNLTSENLDDMVQATCPLTGEDIELLVNTRIVGSSHPNYHPDIAQIEEIIIEGRMFEGLNEVVINDDFASRNNLSVGSTFGIENLFFDISFELTVVGIFSADAFEHRNLMFINIFTSFDTIAAAAGDTNEGFNVIAEYFLRNPDYLESFEREVRAKGLPDTYIVSINQMAFDRVTGPMLSMQSAVMTFSIIILVLGAVVLALISFLVVRERKYEIGVLRAMGMRRGKVAFGIITEAVSITMLCLVIGLGSGTAIAQPIANNLLESRVATAVARSEELGHDTTIAVVMWGGQMQMEQSVGYRPESEITVGLGGDVIVQIIAITLGLAALSGIIGVSVITRYEPLKILRERS